MTMQEAAIQQLVNRAANGDLKAIKEVIALSKQVQEQEPYWNPPKLLIDFVKSPYQIEQEEKWMKAQRDGGLPPEGTDRRPRRRHPPCALKRAIVEGHRPL